jgi:hypothetical protein
MIISFQVSRFQVPRNPETTENQWKPGKYLDVLLMFQHIKHEAGDTDGLYFVPRAYRGIPDEAKVRIQVRNLFVCFLSLWFRKKLDICRQALFKTPKYRI